MKAWFEDISTQFLFSFVLWSFASFLGGVYLSNFGLILMALGVELGVWSL